MACQQVFNQFFQPFYDQRIENIYRMSPATSSTFDLSVLTFWSSVIDFYGGLYYIGKKNQYKTHRSGDLKLSHVDAFSLFIKDFFPAPENQYGNFIYDIFRSGIVHQVCAKKSHIYWQHPNIHKLLWVVQQPGNTNEIENKEAHINISVFQQMTYDAYQRFKAMVSNSTDPTLCQNIYNHLLAMSDGLQDGKALNSAFNKLLENGIDLRQ